MKRHLDDLQLAHRPKLKIQSLKYRQLCVRRLYGKARVVETFQSQDETDPQCPRHTRHNES